MKPRVFAALAFFALLLLAGAWLYLSSPVGAPTAEPAPRAVPGTGPANPGSPAQAVPPVSNPLATPSLAANSSSDVPPPPAMPPIPDGAHALALQQLDQINRMLRDYRTIMGSNPTGTNADIMSTIMGGNPKKARLGPPEGMSLNGNGELVDPWGTPYFFHQLSGEHMEIRSAGPDKRMWTGDDLIWK